MKVLVIGSGPIVIGQAAEFDYAGTQACKSLKEEGHEVVLINSNPATIMTDPGVADALYIEPLTPEFCRRVIERERPDALLPTLGGQTGLNLAIQLADAGVLDEFNVRVLGTPLSAIRKAEDRREFRDLMKAIREPVPVSYIVESEEQLRDLLHKEEIQVDWAGRQYDAFAYPRIVRPAYTLGGTGGGIANTPEELWEIGRRGLKLSMRSQIMVEKSLLGWKEVEYEVMRDGKGNCITVCNMENFDPMGVHTGDSIVVAPSQTLSDIEYHMLRTASLKIIQALGIEGGCNVQLAVNPDSFDYYIIEVNPRVSRSSALASKATGYPIARVAAKIAVGKTLDEIENQVTKTTKACFEPALDYCVVKIPRWPFDKFTTGDRTLFTQMKATGEVMAIDRSFEAALMKAVRGLEVKQKDLRGWGSGWGILPQQTQEEKWLGHPAPAEDHIFYEPEEETRRRKSTHLPHWEQPGAIYAVSYRLADSLPREKRDQIAEERKTLSRLRESLTLDSEERRRAEWLFSEKVDALLAEGYGSCVLRDDRAAGIVIEAWLHFNGERYDLYSWCVMPNHCHVMVRPREGYDLAEILHSWKSFTSSRINKELGKQGQLWLDEYYDHLVRDRSDFERNTQYILENPAKGGLKDWRHVSSRYAPDAGAGCPSHRNDDELRRAIKIPTDERLWAIAEGLRRGWSVQEVAHLSRVDKWFLTKVQGLVEREGKEQGQDDPAKTVYKMVDTCAGEFESHTPYYYSTEGSEDDSWLGVPAPHPATGAGSPSHGKRTVVVLGSGPIRIGQGIEFDYSCVHCVWALQELGYRAVIINNNPETVSTDFDTGDGLYFEPVTHPDVLKVVEHEKAIGVVCQFGGQTAINLADSLKASGVQVLGTSPDAIAMAEDRRQFDQLLEKHRISRPRGKAVSSLEEAVATAAEVGYPVLVRPSFVLGGRAMEIVYDEAHMRAFYGEAERESPGQPVLVDKYILGKEAEVDVISDGVDTLVPGIMEHVERAGVHSGDSMAVYPPISLSPDIEWRMVEIASLLARELGVKGMMNIQFVIENDEVFVLEVNPRASRTVPYLSKVSGIPMVQLATRCMMGEKLADIGYGSGLWCVGRDEVKSGGESYNPFISGFVASREEYLKGAKQSNVFAVKAPVFSFQKLAKVEPSLGPEMKSTGEVLGIDSTYEAALYKAMIASGIVFKGTGSVLLTVRDEDKLAAVELGKKLRQNGFDIAATTGTFTALEQAGIEARRVNKITEPDTNSENGSKLQTPNSEPEIPHPQPPSSFTSQNEEGGTEPNILDLILAGNVSMMINTPSTDRVAEEEAAQIRRACIETGVPCVTSIDTASALLSALEIFNQPERSSCLRLEEYFSAKA